MDEFETGKGREPRNSNPHPWWSRLLYLAYGAFAGVAGVFAELEGQRSLAIVSGGIALVLIWKATQRVR